LHDGVDADHGIAHDDDVEATNLAPTALVAVWGLDLNDGTRLDLDEGGTVVGRRPQIPAGSQAGTRTLRLSDPAKMVSRTHALLETDVDCVRITDLNSANGTRVMHDGRVVECSPDEPVTVESGWTVEFGEMSVVVSCRREPRRRAFIE
jgi:pSer/pThr/pTyr-binding forkhead associated (FHA) protein